MDARVFVGNLDFSATTLEVSQLLAYNGCSDHGRIQIVRKGLMAHGGTASCFVSVSSNDEAIRLAGVLDGVLFKGLRLKAELARPRDRTTAMTYSKAAPPSRPKPPPMAAGMPKMVPKPPSMPPPAHLLARPRPVSVAADGPLVFSGGLSGEPLGDNGPVGPGEPLDDNAAGPGEPLDDNGPVGPGEPVDDHGPVGLDDYEPAGPGEPFLGDDATAGPLGDELAAVDAEEELVPDEELRLFLQDHCRVPPAALESPTSVVGSGSGSGSRRSRRSRSRRSSGRRSRSRRRRSRSRRRSRGRRSRSRRSRSRRRSRGRRRSRSRRKSRSRRRSSRS